MCLNDVANTYKQWLYGDSCYKSGVALNMAVAVPVLLPPSSLPRPSHPTLEWTPKRYLTGPQPPPVDDAKVLEQELAAARQLADGKAVKKTRPRRTVDFNGGMGRWTLVRACFSYDTLLTLSSCGSTVLIQHMYLS